MNTESNQRLLESYEVIYALQEDLNARGIKNRVLKNIKIVAYPEFVAMTASHKKVQAWF